jgi:tRNA-uridine 2-sulfurtransferase
MVDPMVVEYSRGRTPNPCLQCNHFIKWGALLDRALALGADFLATGHYARVRREDGEFALLRAAGRAKDQSHMLSALGQKQLACANNLIAADSPESQVLCFLANGDYREFLARHAPQSLKPGPILDRHGDVLGEHAGLAGYTIGQRKGIGLSSPRALYVLELDPVRYAVIVGEADQLGHRELLAERAHRIRNSPPASPFSAEVKSDTRPRNNRPRLN